MSENKRGRFIVIEGIDGAGKTTQIEILAQKLREEGRTVHVTAEPTASVSGGLLRDALGGISDRTACEMAALFVLDRIFHNVNPNGINAMLEKGIDVICDRYYYSSLAYQGSQTDFEWVKDMNLNCPEIRVPDICIFLDLSPEESLKRISKGRTTTELYEKLDTLQSVRNRFFDVFELLKERDNIKVIDTTGCTIEEVAEKISLEIK
ncbi:MAG: dTMP kinase [Clostridia bacterium]|nr:dTMP kinase [Clostridia bacterium]